MNKYGVLLVLLLPLGLLLAGCGDPPTKIGDVCQNAGHCGDKEGEFDLVCDTGIPGGSCTVKGCTPDDHTTPAVAEDEGTCPADSRCVREVDKTTVYRDYCRRSCNQQSDCGEVIVCREVCKEEDGEEVCSEECKNEMECSPFWDMDRDEVPEDAPRACIMKRALYREPTE